MLVHHVRKSPASQPGQALRGSGDLHAWSDSSLYLLRRKDRLELHVEHRSHPAIDPVAVELRQSPAPHLAITGHLDGSEAENGQPVQAKVIDALSERPMTRSALRDRLRIRNQRLGTALADLEAQGRLQRVDGLLVMAGP